MNTQIERPLLALYGPAQAVAAASRLADPMRALGTANTAAPVQALTQRDALLITYADQVREPGRPPLQTLANFARQHLKDVVSGVHILPFYPWSSDDGFSVKDYFAVEPAYGTWEDIARLGVDFDLMFDAVFNHISARSDWFQRFLRDEPAFRDFFVTVEGNPDLSQVVRPRALPLLTEFQTAAGLKKVWTTFSADQVDLNFKNPAVLLAALEALLFYVRQGARFIRLDAVAFLWKEIGTPCLHLPQTHRVIQLMRAVLDEVAPGVRLITETNVPHADNISYFGDGRNEAQLVYNFALPPLTLHSLQTGNAEKLTRWAQSLTLPSDQVTFFNFLASHDGIGLNPARGILSDAEIEALVARTLAHGGFISYKNMPDGSRLPYEMNINYLDALSNPAANEPAELAARKFLSAQAILLSLQGVPGIYFHSLFGSRGHRAGAEASGIPRRINREKLERARLEAELADATSLRARVFAGYRDLLRLRRAHAAFAPASPQRVLDLDPRVFAVLRETADGRDRVLCLHNVSGEAVNVAAPR
ncbi:MAG TPA: sugar phosphorylase, partial [Verrucomicrobiae bacterium]